MDNTTITTIKNKLYTAHGALYGCDGDLKRIANAMQNITDAITLVDDIVLLPTTRGDDTNAPPVVVHCDTS